MIPITAYDFVRLAAAEARLPQPTAPGRLVLEARFVPVRLGISATVRRLARS